MEWGWTFHLIAKVIFITLLLVIVIQYVLLLLLLLLQRCRHLFLDAPPSTQSSRPSSNWLLSGAFNLKAQMRTRPGGGKVWAPLTHCSVQSVRGLVVISCYCYYYYIEIRTCTRTLFLICTARWTNENLQNISSGKCHSIPFRRLWEGAAISADGRTYNLRRKLRRDIFKLMKVNDHPSRWQVDYFTLQAACKLCSQFQATGIWLMNLSRMLVIGFGTHLIAAATELTTLSACTHLNNPRPISHIIT